MTLRGLPVPESERYMTRGELAEFMGCSVSTIQRLERQGLPSVLWSRRLRRFHLPTVLAWANSHQGGQEAA